MKIMMQKLISFNENLCRILKLICEIIILSMTLVVLLQVFFRYVLGDALSWSEEVSRFLMVWLTFLAAPVAYLEKGHVALDFLTDQWKGRPKQVLTLALHILSCILIAIIIWKSLMMFERGLSIKAASVPISMAVVYAAIPCGFFFMLLINLQHLIANFQGAGVLKR